ncbi:cell wall metabolism sensor histidine kinase WalK [Oceanispirochaeta sp.]|jgi:two-component system sensor histidine kinase BaeS|uniref:sensor histidine kinase n=1 Tax=Oceanispirochaeta sp. TaxID=2035350 RepID=UPI0026382818|nr:HAMP domain-containing sensor histidine kinase [Oceanispirochaeta sp.]MDA3955950.1 HAMP domain-containing sensor histidine kinase [Oceanispirochaeta sp.]
MVKRTEKQSLSIALRLMLSSAASVLIAVLMMTLLFTFFLNKRFSDYIRQEKSATRNELVRTLSERMIVHSSLDNDWLEQVSTVYMEQGIFITLNNSEGDIMWSCLKDNADECSMHMDKDDPDFFDNLETAIYKLPGGNTSESALSLNISYDPNAEYSENDRFFLEESFKMLLLSMILALFVSSLASFGLSRSMSRPLRDLSDYALRLANHDYLAGDPFRKGTKEIDALHGAIEQLAFSLEAQEDLRIRLTSDVSHELRTPLTKIQTSLEAMIDGIWPRDEERLKGCLREILRLTGLVRQLDDLNRYDRETEAQPMKPVNLKESLLYVLNMYEQDCLNRNISLKWQLPNVYITGDDEKLKQVWINLMSNALKFTDRGGEINVNLSPGNPVTISFADTGIGIEKQDLPNIFERFYKADNSRNQNGSGLGLSIVKEIINLHAGSVLAESPEGEGFTIRIQLPNKDDKS